MDESAIGEKIARQEKNCTRRSRVLFELLEEQIFVEQVNPRNFK